MDNYIGKKLEGRYELKEIIGIGGMAVVYKAYDSFEDKYVAVKVLKEEYVSNEEFIRRFKNESKAIAVLSHPNIVKVFDVCFSETIQYIVMEYIDGITLKQYIEQQGNLRWKDALNFVVQILRALQHAHDHGIVHRDVKPQNIMVLSNGSIKVTDFGIARFARSEQKTITDKAIGSVHYISPEQARGDNTDEKSDIYSLGVILYEMLTGQLPFQAESAVSVAIMQLQREPELPSSINSTIPLGLEQITMRAMQKNSDKRYKSAAEMLCDLEAFKRDPAVSFDYGLYVDEQPTRFIFDVKTEKKAKKTQFLPILAGITIAFVVVILIIFIPKVMDWFSTVPEHECPNFVGMTIEKAEEEYGHLFNFEKNFQPGDADYGIIFAQSEKAGHAVKENSKIVLTISSGASTVKVRDVAGKTREEAQELLEKDGFKVTFVEVSDDNIQQGLVIRTNPPAKSEKPAGSTITIYVSTGEATAKVKVPDCVGLTKEEAVRLLERSGLKVGTVTTEFCKEEYFEPGTVMSQYPEFEDGVEVGYGSLVDLVISSGTYEVSLNISLPTINNIGYTQGYIELQYNGFTLEHSIYGPAKSDLLEFKPNIVHNFVFEGDEEKLLNCVVLVHDGGSSYVEYMTLNIDCVNGTYEVVSSNW